MSCNCNLRFTSWLDDLIPPNDDQISFSPDLGSFIQSFNPIYSGIWQPLITNHNKFDGKIWADTSFGTGLYPVLSDLIGYENFVKVDSPQFKNWIIQGNMSVGVDVGMELKNNNYTSQGIISNNSKISDSVSMQTINVIRNKLNDEKDNTETGSVNGLIPRIDPESNIERIEIISRGKTFGLTATDNELLQLFSASLGGGGLQWQFSPNQELFKYLSTNEYLSLDYTVFTKRIFSESGETVTRTGQYSIRVSIFGQNDSSPPVIISDTGSNRIDLSEIPAPIANGFITIKDEDLSQEIYAYVKDLTISGNTQGLRSSIDDLKKMLLFGTNKLRDSDSKQNTVEWTFNGSSANFDYLGEGETLVLNYNIYIYDNLGKYTLYNKTITIIGKNEPPSVGLYSIEDRSGGIYNLNFPQPLGGTLSYYDPDTSDSVSVSVLSVGVKYSTLGLVSGFHNAFRSMLSVSAGNRRITWEFVPDTEYLKYLGQGGIVELNYIIEAIDSSGAKAYGLVSIVVVGKNEPVQTDLDTVNKTYELEPPVTETKAIIDYDTFTINDNNTSDLINISILDYKYELTNISKANLPKCFDVSHMLFFLPTNQRKTSFNKEGMYYWVFNSYPQHFRFLNATNKSIKIIYRVLITDSAGSYQIRTLSFNIIGYNQPPDDNSNPFTTPNRYNDYIFGWYRYYDMGKTNDNRYIPGVDFYFGYLDTYLDTNGNSNKYVPEHKNLNISINNSATGSSETSAVIKLIEDNNSLKQYFTNSTERLRALDIISTSPYIDMLTHKLIDIDALDYQRDSYGRILPILKGMSCKPFKDATAGRFASTKQDIFYRLAQKYGLSVLVDEGESLTLQSKFLSDVGPNLSINYNIYIEKDLDQTDTFAFTDTIIKVGDLTNSYQLCKEEEGGGTPIVLDIDSIADKPVISYVNIKLTEMKQGASFNIIEKRLNNNVYSNTLVKKDGGGISNTSSSTILFHGHGGIGYNPSPASAPLFLIGYKPNNINSIEQPPCNIEITFKSNQATRTYLGDISVEYLRTPTRPECEPVVITTPTETYRPDNTLIYDFTNKKYYIRNYAPSVTNYYIPNGYYYANLTSAEKNKLGIDLYDHPSPKTAFLKTHDLRILNPRKTSVHGDIFQLTRKGTYTVQTDISDLDSGYICLEGVTSSGIFNLYVDGNNISSTYDFTPGRFIMCLENIAKQHKNVKVAVDVADECDYSDVKLSHTPHAGLSNDLISKIDVGGSIGFFHPNSGWINDSKYKFKTPMAPYCPAPLTIQQSGMVKDKKMRYDHYFWYDNEKMYNTQYADGFNFMFNMSSINKTIVDNIQKSRFVGIKKDDYYIMTHEFYKFVYNADESPIKQSIQMSYLDMDYSYGYPFNDFKFSVVSPDTIRISSDSNNKRAFAYFDDAILRSEKIQLFDSVFNEQSRRFDTIVSSSYGDNNFLFLQLTSPLPDYLLDGGYIRKDRTDQDRSRSYIIYRSNIARNDYTLKVNKWGHIISGKDLDEYNNSILRQKHWQQSSLFLNQDNRGDIISSGYYFPYSYGTNVYSSGNKKYDIRFRQANPILGPYTEEKKDYGNISYILNKVPANIYLGPYKGPVLISTAPRVQKGNIVATFLDNKTVLAFTSSSTLHNLKGGDRVKFEPVNTEDDLSTSCLELDTDYYVIRNNNSYVGYRFFIGETPTEPLEVCGDFETSEVFAIVDYPKFNYDNQCLGQLQIDYNNKIVGNIFQKEEKPIYAQIQHTNDANQFYKYLPYVLSPSTDRYIEDYNKFIGSIPGEYYAYIDDPLTKEENGFVKTNRYSLYNHNDNLIFKYYTNANGTSATPINKPVLSSGLGGGDQALLERYRQDNNDLIDSAIRSLSISIDTLNEDINTLNSFLSDSSKTQTEIAQYRNEISSIEYKIAIIEQRIDYINGFRVNNPVIDDNNYKKLPLTYNLNIPSGYYNAHNSFLDMNIFGTDQRTKPTLLPNVGQPAVSGYVYFEGLVEPPLSDFYNSMETPYNDNLWIDIPENANLSIMTKYGQIFNSQEEYSVLLETTRECDKDIKEICDEQYSEPFCGKTENVEGGEKEFFKKIGINDHKNVFDTKVIELPKDCASLDLCCNTMVEHDIIHRSMFYGSHPDNDGYYYPSTLKCIEINNNIKKECQKIIEEYTFCPNHKCPITSYFYGQFNLIGTLKNDNFSKNNHAPYYEPYANGEVRFPKKNESNLYPEVLYPGNKDVFGTGGLNTAAGYSEVKSKKILLFKIKKNKIQNLIPPSTDSLTFINTPDTYPLISAYPASVFANTYIGAPGLPKKLDTQMMIYPTESVGSISCMTNPEYISNNRLYRETFDYINNPERILLKPNSNSTIWQNEIKYRHSISHPNKINGPLMEYDISFYGEHNPYYHTPTQPYSSTYKLTNSNSYQHTNN